MISLGRLKHRLKIHLGFINEANVLIDGKVGEVTKLYEDIKNKLNVGGVLQMV